MQAREWMQAGQKRIFAALPLAMTVGTLPGCGDNGADATPGLTAASLGSQEMRSSAAYLAEEPYLGADIRKGEQTAAQCRACHTLSAGGAHRIGPNLHGMFGRRAGAADGFDYSVALADAGFHWTPRALDAWLSAPQTFLPGNRMSFAGISDGGDRADLVAYLLTETSSE